MGIFGKKDQPKTFAPEPPPVLSPRDLANATAMMERWDRSLGQNEAMWDCLEAIAALGGFRGAEATLMEVMDGKDAHDVTARPWRWWAEASRAALATGDHMLPCKVFLFSYLFVNQSLPKMNAVTQADVGLGHPGDGTYKSIADQAIQAMVGLPPSMLIHDTRTGKVDVASGLRVARLVAGAA